MELIIVIAIMALLVGTAFFSINMIFGASAKTCANNIKEALAENKVTAMGKSEARVEIYRKDSDNCVYVRQWVKEGGVWESKEPEQIGNSRVYVAYKDGDAVEELTTDSDRHLWLCYDRGSGSFKEAEDDGPVKGCILCDKIYVRGGSRSYELTLVQLTGKVEMELLP